MNPRQYSPEYFSEYQAKGRFLRCERGQRWHQFAYWARHISRRYASGSAILEIGCGLGYFGRAISKDFIYIGTDISLFPLQTARAREVEGNFVQSDGALLAFRSDSFDVVVAFDILEHMPDPSFAVAEMYRVLRKNGRIIATTPNTRSLGNRIKSSSAGLMPSMYRDKTHISLLSKDEWIGAFHDAGFEVLKSDSDTLWDIPYSTKVPSILQKMLLVPFNWSVSYLFGSVPWTLGENLVFICKK